jgi:hypothetical protein
MPTIILTSSAGNYQHQLRKEKAAVETKSFSGIRSSASYYNRQNTTMALDIIRIVALISGLQFTVGFQSPTLQRHSLRISSLSAANKKEDDFSLDRRSAIATTSLQY